MTPDTRTPEQVQIDRAKYEKAVIRALHRQQTAELRWVMNGEIHGRPTDDDLRRALTEYKEEV